jgi:hypothetical protein
VRHRDSGANCVDCCVDRSSAITDAVAGVD